MARGYWQRPELTAERFLAIPALGPGRIYRTGDLARFLPDGNIDFLGRADYQIKLRGHRIEPGEIEALLEKCPGVRQAVVVLREDREGDKRLVAYLVAERRIPLRHHARRAICARRPASKLPDYMVPSAFVFLDELPLTGNGKIDRKALLKLPAAKSRFRRLARPPNPPARWSALSRRPGSRRWAFRAVGLTDNFFDLGAHSLTVAEAHAKLQEALGREIALLDLFQFTTVSALAAHLDAQSASSSAGRTAASQLSERAARRRMARQQEATAP